MPGAAAVQHRRRRSPAEVEVLQHRRPIIVTIDGPAGTGKSTVARELAKLLDIDFLDTGAMYRAAAAVVLDAGVVNAATFKPGVDRLDPRQVLPIIEKADIKFDWTCDPPMILAFGNDMESRIRDADVTGVVSPIAGVAELRALMVEKQREIGRQHPRLVTEGRDQGSVVFPDATVKFYLDASPEVRAVRRAEQLKAAGHEPDLDRLLDEIIKRDRSDMTRAVGPLVCPKNAIRVDTSHLALSEVVAELERRTMELAGR